MRLDDLNSCASSFAQGIIANIISLLLTSILYIISKKHTNLIIQVTSEIKEGIKSSGKLNFILKGGILIE